MKWGEGEVEADRARGHVRPSGCGEEDVLGLEVSVRELDRVEVGERLEAVERHARDLRKREEAACQSGANTGSAGQQIIEPAGLQIYCRSVGRPMFEWRSVTCVQSLASRAPLRLALHAPQRMVQRGTELVEDEAAVPLRRESANQSPDRKVKRSVFLHLEQDFSLDLCFAAVLLDSTDHLDGDVTLLQFIPHLDDSAEGALAQLLDHPVAVAIKPVVHSHDVVPFCPLLLLRSHAFRRRAGRIFGGTLGLSQAALEDALLPGDSHASPVGCRTGPLCPRSEVLLL